jgi:hypothetical protein
MWFVTVYCKNFTWKDIFVVSGHSARCCGRKPKCACYDVMILVSGGGSTSWPWVFCCCIFVSTGPPSIEWEMKLLVRLSAHLLRLVAFLHPPGPSHALQEVLLALVQGVLISSHCHWQLQRALLVMQNFHQERPVSAPRRFNLTILSYWKLHLVYTLPSCLPTVPSSAELCLRIF